MDVLERARAGDERAFRELVAPYERELRGHCYRMLGSLSDADDALQETLLAAWRGLDGFAGRASLRTWLHRIATRRCLNARRDDARRTPAASVPPFAVPEPTARDTVPWLQPWPDALLAGLPEAAPGPEARYTASEAIELAFVTALQRVPPRQAAVLLLRDVLGYGGDETATLLDVTPTVVKGVLQRARAALAAARHVAPAARPGPAAEDAVAARFARAYLAGDVDGVVALLTDRAWLAMPPAPHRYAGRAAIAAFLEASFAWRAGRPLALRPVGRHRSHPTRAPYHGEPGGDAARPAGLYVVTVSGDRVDTVTRFHDPRVFGHADLPGSAVPG